MAVLAERRPPASSVRREMAETVRTVVGALLIALVLRTVFFQPFTIPSSSMEPGLVTGDYVLVSKYSYGWSRASLPFNPPLPAGRFLFRPPQRGDVVVFRLPRDPRVAYVKRLIGLPGDRIQVWHGMVLVNDRAIPRTPLGEAPDHDDPLRPVQRVAERLPGRAPYVTYDAGSGHDGDDTGVYVVPAGHYFMMGDNRDNSLDSRWPRQVGVGFVPADDLIGKAQVVLLSWRQGASIFKPWTWFSLQTDRFLHRIR